MTKKIFALIIGIILIVSTSYVFAANAELSDSMNKSGNTIRNVVGGAENVIEDTAGAIGTGIRDLGNTFADGASRVRNNGNNGNSGYTTTRTATNPTNNGTFLGMNSNTWTWFILAIVTIAIVGLVWYYAMQNKNEYNNNNH